MDNAIKTAIEELQGLDINEANKYEVFWVDRNHKSGTKLFNDNPQGAPENGLKKAKLFLKKLEDADKKDKYGLYRSLGVRTISEGQIVNEFFSIDPDKQAEFVKKAWHDGLHAGRTTTGANSEKKWKQFAKEHRIDESSIAVQNAIGELNEVSVNEGRSMNSYAVWRSKQSPNELEQVKSAIAMLNDHDYWVFGDWVFDEFIGLNPPHKDGDIMDKPEDLDTWLNGMIKNKPGWKLIVKQLKKLNAL